MVLRNSEEISMPNDESIKCEHTVGFHFRLVNGDPFETFTVLETGLPPKEHNESEQYKLRRNSDGHVIKANATEIDKTCVMIEPSDELSLLATAHLECA
jgi:hypothetical protein